MIKYFVLLIIFAVFPCSHRAVAASSNADFYVSPDGSDMWSGTLCDPDGQGDGPFATLVRARDAVRELKKTRSGDIVVLIRGGIYQLSETVLFRVEDGGDGASTITYAAYPGEKPVLSSGRQIRDWKQAPSDLPGLPKAARGRIRVAHVRGSFKTLFDGTGMLPRAQSEGFIPTEDGSKTEIHFPKEKLKEWSNLSDVEIIVRPHHAWISNILPLASVDEGAGIAITAVEATYAINRLHFLKDTPNCWVENVLEELDQPGEWVLNTEEGKLYLWPRNETPVMAPQLLELIRVEGDVDFLGPTDVPVRNLVFRGLTFMHGDRYTMAEDDAGLQHDWDFLDKANSLVRLRGTENCVIKDCDFAHSGSGAIRVDLHGMNNTISGNHIEHMGGGGILLCGYGPGTKDVNRRNLVYNNHVHHVGQIYTHSPGIFIWQSGENRVANNLIHNTPYSGMIVSGCMTHFFERADDRELARTIRWHEVKGGAGRRTDDETLPYKHTHDNMIEYNEIHHVMEKMGDGNGIYVRGAGAGNVLRRNYVHHLVAPMHMQAGLRTDGGQRDTLITENIVYKCTAQGIILKLNNHAENNFIIDIIAPPRGYYMSLREGPMNGAAIKRNIFYSSTSNCTFYDELDPKNGKTEDSRGRALAFARDADTDFNIYYCASDPMLGQEMLSKQRKDGVDVHSMAADPLFVDVENGDFRFKPGSPALEMGIVPIDLSKIGLRK